MPASPVPPSWQLLRAVPAFSHLDSERLRWLAKQLRWCPMEAGQAVDQPFNGACVHVLLAGQLQVLCTNVQGKELLLGELFPGQMFGNTWLSASIPQGMMVVATEHTLLAAMDKVATQEWLMTDSTIVAGILNNATDLLWQLVGRVVEMGTLNVRSRLHMRLLALAQRQGVQHNQVTLTPSPTQASLAAYLGASREEVAREMSRLVRLGLLQRQGRSIVLLNVDGLIALADAQ
ncbi:Crp/Fnr family transcriptional regulator [Comamonas sp. NoAH]|uniref:Crp/Fnr family transcriptional regulator n=1 Tax=Comamonas halotolerans TaxID=3041496 RepID=UPI0024E116E6|nr:Crp/Fnr family transcriptional regulator [Comamonas sp. NoAH]